RHPHCRRSAWRCRPSQGYQRCLPCHRCHHCRHCPIARSIEPWETTVMSLDKNGLQTSIGAAFEKAKATPRPADPKDSDNIQRQVLSQLAQDLAAAIDTFVRSGDVLQVTVQVKDNANNVLGTGTQTGNGKIL